MNEIQFDQLLHIETGGNQYGYPTLTHYHRYEPTPYAALDQLFEKYSLESTDCVVDMGCGKGRVPFMCITAFIQMLLGLK